MTPWYPPAPLPGLIQTSRTLIRSFERGDGTRLHEAVTVSRGTPWLWLNWAESGHPDDSLWYVEKHRRQSRKPDNRSYTRPILNPQQTEILGCAGFHNIDHKQRTAELGFWIRSDRHGRGLCTEAMEALITQGLRPQERGGWGFRRLTMLCAAENRGSVRVAEKLGLRLERQERAERYVDDEAGGRFLDSLGFAVLAEEWPR